MAFKAVTKCLGKWTNPPCKRTQSLVLNGALNWVKIWRHRQHLCIYICRHAFRDNIGITSYTHTHTHIYTYQNGNYIIYFSVPTTPQFIFIDANCVLLRGCCWFIIIIVMFVKLIYSLPAPYPPPAPPPPHPLLLLIISPYDRIPLSFNGKLSELLQK